MRPLRIVPLAFLLLFAGGCPRKDEPPAPRPPPEARPVEVYEVRPLPYRRTVTQTGTLEPSAVVTLSAEVTARVVDMGFEEGDELRPGQMLYRLDDRDLRQALRARDAAIEEARVALARARTELERAQALAGRGAATRERLDTARFAVEAARARLATLQAERDRLELQIEKTRITSPGRYKAVQVLARVGSLAVPGQPLVRLAAVDPVDLVIPVASRRVRFLRKGRKVRVRVDGVSGSVEGVVRDVSFALPPEPGFVRVRIRIPNPTGRLLPGQVARVELPAEERNDLVWIPAEALVERLGVPGVYVVEDGRARFRGVSTGRVWGDRVEVREGLRMGEQVIVVGQSALSPGDPVDLRRKR